jgi:hypothetical protein
MMTALILAEGAPEGLAVTLGALVPAVVEGLIGDAVVIGRQADSPTEAIAEVAGAAIVIASPGTDPWREGAALARREWLLCLQSGDVPGDGWMRAVDRFLAAAARNGQPLGRFSRKAGAASVLIDLAERVAGTRTVRPGDLVRRDRLTGREPARVRPVRIGARLKRDLTLR